MATILYNRFGVFSSHLKMELESENGGSQRKGLIGSEFTGGQSTCAFGKIERITMPMERNDFVWNLGKQPRFLGRLGESDWEPTDLLLGAWIDLGAKNIRNKLRAKTDTKNFLAFANGAINKSLFLF